MFTPCLGGVGHNHPKLTATTCSGRILLAVMGLKLDCYRMRSRRLPGNAPVIYFPLPDFRSKAPETLVKSKFSTAPAASVPSWRRNAITLPASVG